MRKCIHILIYRTFRSMYFGSFDSSFQFYFSRIHQWRMESTTHFQRKSTFGSGSFHQFARLFDTRYRAGDNDLSRAVVVGRYANFTFCIYCCTDFFYFFIRQCDNSSHGGRSSFASFLHSHCTCIHKFQSIFKTQCTGSNQCRELTK